MNHCFKQTEIEYEDATYTKFFKWFKSCKLSVAYIWSYYLRFWFDAIIEILIGICFRGEGDISLCFMCCCWVHGFVVSLGLGLTRRTIFPASASSCYTNEFWARFWCVLCICSGLLLGFKSRRSIGAIRQNRDKLTINYITPYLTCALLLLLTFITVRALSHRIRWLIHPQTIACKLNIFHKYFT